MTSLRPSRPLPRQIYSYTHDTLEPLAATYNNDGNDGTQVRRGRAVRIH
jgi:hypothetical protein